MARDLNESSTMTAVVVFIGIVPALLLTMLAVIGAAFVGGPMRLLELASFLGTAGLIWGLLGATARLRWVLLLMLGIGEVAMLLLVVPLLMAAASSQTWTWNWIALWGYLAAGWFTLGPMSAGAILILEQLKRGSRLSEDRL